MLRIVLLLPLAVASLLAASFVVLLLVLLLRPASAGIAWSVADTPGVLAATIFLLAGVAVVTGVGAVLGYYGGTQASWTALAIAGAFLAIVCLVWFADRGRALVLALPCAYLAVYGAMRCRHASGGRRRD